MRLQQFKDFHTFKTSSSKHCWTLTRVLALHSIKRHPDSLAKFIPSFFVTTLSLSWKISMKLVVNTNNNLIQTSTSNVKCSPDMHAKCLTRGGLLVWNIKVGSKEKNLHWSFKLNYYQFKRRNLKNPHLVCDSFSRFTEISGFVC